MERKEASLTSNSYKCAICGGVFNKGWSDEEAMSEMKELWGDCPEEELAVMCDDCFNGITPGTRSHTEVLAEIEAERRKPS